MHKFQFKHSTVYTMQNVWWIFSFFFSSETKCQTLCVQRINVIYRTVNVRSLNTLIKLWRAFNRANVILVYFSLHFLCCLLVEYFFFLLSFCVVFCNQRAVRGNYMIGSTFSFCCLSLFTLDKRHLWLNLLHEKGFLERDTANFVHRVLTSMLFSETEIFELFFFINYLFESYFNQKRNNNFSSEGTRLVYAVLMTHKNKLILLTNSFSLDFMKKYLTRHLQC